jgi:hypothetical protein
MTCVTNNTLNQMEDQDEDYHLPLLDQRVFGAGLKRKRIQFVPPASTSTTFPSQTIDGPSVGDKYLSIVLPLSATPTPPPSQDSSTPGKAPESHARPLTCEICELPITLPDEANNAKPHESSLAHQSCLPHSHPPSHLPRDHVGLKYLESYGWDPDARMGLGVGGKGIRIPIKGKVKSDTVGLGVKIKKGKVAEAKVQRKLHAGEVRRAEMESKRKGERLRERFYGNEDVERYLGGG